MAHDGKCIQMEMGMWKWIRYLGLQNTGVFPSKRPGNIQVLSRCLCLLQNKTVSSWSFKTVVERTAEEKTAEEKKCCKKWCQCQLTREQQ